MKITKGEKLRYKTAEAKKCPFCGSDSISVVHKDVGFIGQNVNGIKKIRMRVYCTCNICHSKGKPISYIGYAGAPLSWYNEERLPIYSCGDKAIEEWNKRVD